MRWTDEKIAELRRMADAGYPAKEAGASLGVSKMATKTAAQKRGISFHGQRGRRPIDPDDSLRARWATMIGPMKDALRREIVMGKDGL